MNPFKSKSRLSKLFVILLIFSQMGMSQNSISWLNEGDNFFKQSNFEEALNSYSLYIDEHPDDPRGYLHRARLNATLGNTNASQHDFKLAENLNPLSHMYLDAKIRSNFYAEKFYDYGIANSNEAFTKSPLRMSDYINFIDTLAISHKSDSIIINVIEQIANKNYVEAKNGLEQIEVNQRNSPIINDLRGLIKLKTGDVDAAIGLFSKVIEQEPNFAIAYHNRAICYKLENKFEKAKNDLVKAISINDDLPMFHFAFAKLNQKMKNFDTASEYYKKAIDIDKNYLEAAANYSQLLKNIGDYETSLLYLSEIKYYKLESSEQHYLIANLHFVYGEYKDAKYHFTEFLSEFPEDNDALYNLGITILMLREYDEGCECISKSLNMHKNQMRMEVYDSYCSNIF